MITKQFSKVFLKSFWLPPHKSLLVLSTQKPTSEPSSCFTSQQSSSQSPSPPSSSDFTCLNPYSKIPPKVFTQIQYISQIRKCKSLTQISDMLSLYFSKNPSSCSSLSPSSNSSKFFSLALDFLNEFTLKISDNSRQQLQILKILLIQLQGMNNISFYHQTVKLSIISKISYSVRYNPVIRALHNQIFLNSLMQVQSRYKNIQSSGSSSPLLVKCIYDIFNVLVSFRFQQFNQLVHLCLKDLQSGLINELNEVENNKIICIMLHQFTYFRWWQLSSYHQILDFLVQKLKFNFDQQRDNFTTFRQPEHHLSGFRSLCKLRLHLVGPKKIPTLLNSMIVYLHRKIDQIFVGDLFKIMQMLSLLPAQLHPQFRSSIVEKLKRIPNVIQIPQFPIAYLNNSQIEYFFRTKKSQQIIWKQIIFCDNFYDLNRFLGQKVLGIVTDKIDLFLKFKFQNGKKIQMPDIAKICYLSLYFKKKHNTVMMKKLYQVLIGFSNINNLHYITKSFSLTMILNLVTVLGQNYDEIEQNPTKPKQIIAQQQSSHFSPSSASSYENQFQKLFPNLPKNNETKRRLQLIRQMLRQNKYFRQNARKDKMFSQFEYIIKQETNQNINKSQHRNYNGNSYQNTNYAQQISFNSLFSSNFEPQTPMFNRYQNSQFGSNQKSSSSSSNIIPLSPINDFSRNQTLVKCLQLIRNNIDNNLKFIQQLVMRCIKICTSQQVASPKLHQINLNEIQVRISILMQLLNMPSPDSVSPFSSASSLPPSCLKFYSQMRQKITQDLLQGTHIGKQNKIKLSDLCDEFILSKTRKNIDGVKNILKIISKWGTEKSQGKQGEQLILNRMLIFISSLEPYLILDKKGRVDSSIVQILNTAQKNDQLLFGNKQKPLKYLNQINRALSILLDHQRLQKLNNNIYNKGLDLIYQSLIKQQMKIQTESSRLIINFLFKFQKVFNDHSKQFKFTLQKVYKCLQCLLHLDKQPYLQIKLIQFTLIYRKFIKIAQGEQILHTFKVQQLISNTISPSEHQLSSQSQSPSSNHRSRIRSQKSLSQRLLSETLFVLIKLHCFNFSQLQLLPSVIVQYYQILQKNIKNNTLSIFAINSLIENLVFQINLHKYVQNAPILHNLKAFLSPLLTIALKNCHIDYFYIIKPHLKYRKITNQIFGKDFVGIFSHYLEQRVLGAQLQFLIDFIPFRYMKKEILQIILKKIQLNVGYMDSNCLSFLYFFQKLFAHVPQEYANLREKLWRNANNHLAQKLEKVQNIQINGQKIQRQRQYYLIGRYSYYMFACIKAGKIQNNQIFLKLMKLVLKNPNEFASRIKKPSLRQIHENISNFCKYTKISPSPPSSIPVLSATKPQTRLQFQLSYRTSTHLENVLRKQGISFKRNFYVDNIRFSYYLPEKNQAIIVVGYEGQMIGINKSGTDEGNPSQNGNFKEVKNMDIKDKSCVFNGILKFSIQLHKWFLNVSGKKVRTFCQVSKKFIDIQ